MKKKIHLQNLLTINQLQNYVNKGAELLEKNRSLLQKLNRKMDKLIKETEGELFTESVNNFSDDREQMGRPKSQTTLLYCMLIGVLDDKVNLQQEVQKIGETYDNVVSLITHEFKNILTSVHGYNMLIENELRELNDENIHNNLLAGDRLVRQLFDMSDSLLKMSLGEKGLLDPEYKLINLIEDVIYPVMNDLQPEFARKQMSVEIKKPSADPLLEADESLLDIVMRNLLINAMRYGKDNTAILIKIDSLKDRINVAVRNQCLKIPADFCNGIFNKFQKKNIGSIKGGSGLGLFNVHNIITLHQGKITCSTSEGKWIEFRFNLPKKFKL